jgi:hypothetical protein
MSKQELIKILSKHLKKKGYEVIVENIIPYAGHISDLEAIKGREKLCIEIINGNNLDTEKTKVKWQALSGNREWDFCIFTKESKVEEVRKLLKEWKITYRKIWSVP